MHAYSLQHGRALARPVEFSRCRRLLDVGGASGASSIRMADVWPDLEPVVFDLPGAVAIAREKIEEAGLSGRISTESGDFLNGPLPADFDAVLVSHVMHDWDPETSRFILRKCLGSLSAGGTLIIADFILDDDLTGPLPAALSSVIMLVAQKGQCYSSREYTDWLIASGLEQIRRVSIAAPGANGLIIAQKRTTTSRTDRIAAQPQASGFPELHNRADVSADNVLAHTSHVVVVHPWATCEVRLPDHRPLGTRKKCPSGLAAG